MNEQKYKEMVEGQGQVLEEVVVRLDSLENREYPDYRDATKRIDLAVGQLVQSVVEIKEKVTAIPKAIPVEYIHKLDPKNRKVLLLIVGLIVALITLSIWVVSLYGDQAQFEEQALKYRFIRQIFPVQSDKADSAYAADPVKIKQVISDMEEKAVTSSHAQDIANQKTKEAEEAKSAARAIAKSSKHARSKVLTVKKNK